MNDRDVEILGRAPLFEALDDEGSRALRAIVTEVHLSRGQTLFTEDQEGDRLYVVLEGKIKLTRTAPRTAGRTCSACWARARCSASCRCSTPGPARPARSRSPKHASPGSATTTCGRGSPATPRSRSTCCARSPSGCAVPTTSWPTWSSPTCPAGSPRRCSTWPSGSASRPTSGLHVHHDLTQEELAQLVGASRETVNKALADFAQRGWLRIEATRGGHPRHRAPPQRSRCPRRHAGPAAVDGRSGRRRRRSRQVVELRPHRQLRGGPQRPVDVGVDRSPRPAGPSGRPAATASWTCSRRSRRCAR